jgi:hypothetical protein
MATMSRRTPAVRACWLVAAALQLALPGAAAWADARLDSAGAHATPHIESHTSKSCARIHAPDCALCHFLSAPTLQGRAIRFHLDVADSRVARPAAPAPSLGAPDRLLPQPRAPPVLS